MTQPMADQAAERELGRGTVVAVVGPSGVGKDSLIDFARQHFSGRPDIRFVRRTITRPQNSIGEDHHAVTDGAFDALVRSGAFAVHWEAHGLGYGIPADIYEDLAAGHIVIANGSRSALDAFRAAFPRLLVVNVTARLEILAERLAARGRETAADISARLGRAITPLMPNLDIVDIDNSGELTEAGKQLVSLIEDRRVRF